MPPTQREVTGPLVLRLIAQGHVTVNIMRTASHHVIQRPNVLAERLSEILAIIDTQRGEGDPLKNLLISSGSSLKVALLPSKGMPIPMSYV